jgi:hypothetical protein
MRLLQLLVATTLAVAVVSMGASVSPVASQTREDAPRDIGPADPMRKPLLDALRPAVERDLGQPVQFVVTTLRRQSDWAFAVVTPQAKDGSKIDYLKTRHAQRIRDGMFDGGYVQALLRQEGGRWVVKDFAVGPTDVYYAGWPDQFGAPYLLFGLKKPD